MDGIPAARILVTGATGYIGSRLIARLADFENIAVYGLERPTVDLASRVDPVQIVPSNMHMVQADLRDYAVLQNLVKTIRPQIIYHLAAAGVRNPFLPLEDAISHNFDGTLNLVRAAFEINAGEEGPVQMIIGRTPGEISAMNHYAASKAAAWQICRMYARTRRWPITGAMIFQVYGPGQSAHSLIGSAVRAALSGQDFPMTTGLQRRDWIYISDVIDGLVAAGSASLEPGTTVELGRGELTSVAEVVRMIYQLVGGGGQPQIGELPTRPGEVVEQIAAVTRTAELLQWRAVTPLDTGLKIVVDSFQN